MDNETEPDEETRLLMVAVRHALSSAWSTFYHLSVMCDNARKRLETADIVVKRMEEKLKNEQH